MSVKVRPAKKEDADSIVDFQLKMALETENLELDQGVVEKGVASVFKDPGKGTYYITESEGNIIASLLTTREWSDWRNGQVLWLQSLYVLPEYRRKGIFKRMYFFLKNKVEKDEELKGLRLYVDKSNLIAQKVYNAIGMDHEHYQMYEWMKE